MFNVISEEDIYSHFENFFANREAIRQRIKKWIPQNCHLLFDLGCKNGAITCSYSNSFKKVIGIDKNFNHLFKAAKKYPQITFINGDVSFLPFKDSCAEVIVSTEILQYIPKNGKVFYEANRVLKSDGYFLVSVPQKGIFFEHFKYLNYDNLKNILKKIKADSQKESILQPYSLQEIENISKGLFTIEKLEKRGFLLYPIFYLFLRILVSLTLFILPDTKKQEKYLIILLFSRLIFFLFKCLFRFIGFLMMLDSNLNFGSFSYSLLISMRKNQESERTVN